MSLKDLPPECTSWFRSEIEYYETEIVLRLQSWKWLKCDKSGDLMFSFVSLKINDE